LQMAPSICVHCGVGCNITAGERYGTLRRVINRYNGEVNGYFLCDRGRFGYEFVNSEQRIRQPLLRQNGRVEPITKEAALSRLGSVLADQHKVIGIGSPRASLEANFALRSLVGPDRFFAGISDNEFVLVSTMLEILRRGPSRSPSLREVELSDAVLDLGEDLTNTAPRIALALRQSVRQQPMQIAQRLHIPPWLDHAVREALQDEKGPLFVATTCGTKLDDVAKEAYRAAPDDLARLGFAVAHALDDGAPAVADLPELQQVLAQRIAQALKLAKRPLVVSGPSCNNLGIIQAAANVAWALGKNGHSAGLSFTAPECNSFGLGLLGGRPLGAALELVREGKANTVVILENDLYRRAQADSVDALLEGARHIIVLDHLQNRTSAKAELVLPAATFAEADGTLVSGEGRAQRFFRVFVLEGDVQESWRWLRDAMLASGHLEAAAWENLDHVIDTMSAEPALARVAAAAPLSGFRMAGAKIPREPHRYSGRTSMLAQVSVHEPKPPDDPDSPLSFSMEGTPDHPPSALIPFFWSPGWNSIQSVMKFQEEVNGPLLGSDAGVRLFEPAQVINRSYFSSVPAAFKARDDEWFVVALYHIFGSEELSRSAPAVAELAPEPYVAVNPEDSGTLRLKAGDEVELSVAGSAHRLPVKVRLDLPRGVVGVAAGLTFWGGTSLPAWGRLARVS
jgi:NADH-quinone oxidoreductase subunit G